MVESKDIFAVSDTNVPTLSTNPSLTEQATGLLPPSATTEQNSRFELSLIRGQVLMSILFKI